MSQIVMTFRPVAPVLENEQIRILLALQGIAPQQADLGAITALARYILAQAALIAAPLPFDLEPASAPGTFRAGEA